jgi:hypothetical protein
MPLIYPLVGVSGSGKSSWVLKHGFGPITYCRDKRRRELFPGQPWTPEIAAVINQDERFGLVEILETSPVAISDGTHLDWDQYERAFRDLGGLRPVFFPVTVEECLRRQAGREEENQVPWMALKVMFGKVHDYVHGQQVSLTPEHAALEITSMWGR